MSETLAADIRDAETLAPVLASKMAENRWSDRLLAAHLGLDKSAVCRARTGKEVKVATFLILCRWLGFQLRPSSPTHPTT